jgi:GNAT superfamily N-acetyltransferase
LKGYTIVEAAEEALDDFILLLEQTGKWLWKKGIKQWEPGTLQKGRGKLERYVKEGCLILAKRDGKLAGGCILSTVNPCWPKESEEAMYLNSLAVARFAAGEGLGTKIIEGCAEAVRRRGKRYIRLDCWDGNDFLKAYYQREGFKMLEAVPEDDYWVRLFEKDVGRGE